MHTRLYKMQLTESTMYSVVVCTMYMFTICMSGQFRGLQLDRSGIHGGSGHNHRSRRDDCTVKTTSRYFCPCIFCTALSPSGDDSPPLDFPHLNEQHTKKSTAQTVNAKNEQNKSFWQFNKICPSVMKACYQLLK